MEENNTFSVSALMSMYSNSLHSSFDAKIVVLEGFYNDKKGKCYSGNYYDDFFDKDKKHSITIQVNESLKSQLESGRYYHLQGYINKGQKIGNNSRLQIFFKVTKLLKYEKDVQIISKVEYDIVRERMNRDFPIIQDILLNIFEQNEIPKIDIITGSQSIVASDFESQLQSMDYYEINYHKCNLSSQTEILSLLNTHNFSSTDLIIVIRGGGSGLEVFNEIELCKKFIELPVPFITGIGHEEDKTLLQRISDKAFSTPSAVGTYLQKMVHIHNEREEEFSTLQYEKDRELSLKDKEIENIEKKFEEEKLLLKEQIINQKKTNTKIWFFVFIFFVLIIVLTVTLLK